MKLNNYTDNVAQTGTVTAVSCLLQMWLL